MPYILTTIQQTTLEVGVTALIIILIIVESVTVKSFEEYSFKNIPDKENNNGGQYQLKNIFHNNLNVFGSGLKFVSRFMIL